MKRSVSANGYALPSLPIRFTGTAPICRLRSRSASPASGLKTEASTNSWGAPTAHFMMPKTTAETALS